MAVLIAGCAPGTPPDAPPLGCPAIGTTPRFSGQPRLAIAQRCLDYTASADTGTATAMCFAPTFGLVAAYGPTDGDLSPVTLATHASDAAIVSVSLSPEGDFMLARSCGTSCRTASYQHDNVGWRWSADLDLPAFSDVRSSGPTRGPHRHMIVVDDQTAFHELVEDDAGAWQERAVFKLFAPTATPLQSGPVYLSPDGLRLAFTTNDGGVFYTGRADINAAWAPPTWLTGVPTLPHRDAFLTEDCERLYYSTDGGITYVERVD